MALRGVRQVSGDTWYNLVLGREILERGLIEHNGLTEQGFGAACVDQQWLAHLLIYGLEASFGVAGLVVLSSLTTVSSLLFASRHALRQGATPGRVLLIGSSALIVLTAQTTVRAQLFALPFLAIFPCLFSGDAARPSRQIWWTVPCTALWANLHGSVLLAPVMGLLLLAGRVIDTSRASGKLNVHLLFRDAILTLSLALSLFATPYYDETVDYYLSTVANPTFRTYISEWQPPTIADAPEVWLLAGLVLSSLARGFRELKSFELSLCLLLTLFTLQSVRFATPLSLAACALVPRAADALFDRALRFEWDGRLEHASRWLLLVGVAGLVALPWLTRRGVELSSSIAFARRVAEAAGPGRRILVDERHADRLLWHEPALKGRISHNARVETLPPEFLRSLSAAYADPTLEASRAFVERYDIVVVDRDHRPALSHYLARAERFTRFAADPFAEAFQRTDAAHLH